MDERCCNCAGPAAGGLAKRVLVWGVEVIRHLCNKCANKKACRCPTDWCRLEPDNGAKYCPDLREDEICGYK